jgi:hypothetical protein
LTGHGEETSVAPTIEKRQQAMFSHRMNFWGRPGTSPNTVSWKYRGQPWLIQRPDDGELPEQHSIRCKECKKTVTYSVHSVKAALGRQKRWRMCAYTGFVSLLVGALGLIFFHGNGPAWIAVSAALLVGGFVSGCTFGTTAAEETGITGHFAAWPGATKHMITFVETPSSPDLPDLPDLICERCGYQEQYLSSPHLVRSFVEKKYAEAKVRFDNHKCKKPAATR